jgi:hypothetical protein
MNALVEEDEYVSHLAVFFFHNKSANSIFTRNFSDKRIRSDEGEKKVEITEYKMASKLMSKWSFHLEKSRSATTATTNDCTVLNRHYVTVTTILSGQSFSKAGCTVNRQTEQTQIQQLQLWMQTDIKNSSSEFRESTTSLVSGYIMHADLKNYPQRPAHVGDHYKEYPFDPYRFPNYWF